MNKVDRIGVSLFSGAGIGDLGFREAGIDFSLMAEIDPRRAELAALNFPETKVLADDIWTAGSQIIDLVKAVPAGRKNELFLVTCTAPCQGMSKNGQGTLLRNVRLGKRPRLDPRNRLILPALEVIKALRPRWVVFENVVEMADTIIQDQTGQLRPVLEIIETTLGESYVGDAYNLEFADYGIPQRRRRLITIYSRSDRAWDFVNRGGGLVPSPTHSAQPQGSQRRWLSVAETLKPFPPLDASSPDQAKSDLPFHRVPLLDSRKYDWVAHTPPGAGAFDNQCPKCGFSQNPVHGSSFNSEGINQSKRSTPLFCKRCSGLLPRPYVTEKDGSLRIMRGYTSAYKRMNPDLPAPTLTRNLSYACSDQKLHPFENRVLSLAEAFTLHTLSKYEYKWGPLPGRPSATDTTIRLVLGESIPPRISELIMQHILAIEQGRAKIRTSAQLRFI